MAGRRIWVAGHTGMVGSAVTRRLRETGDDVLTVDRSIVDLRNLLAQGYIPVVAQDGQTVYLVQSARSVRGGVAFSF